mmetsp:Transcript_12119/g.32610  ORF Transcript_12119/g.32610 Transcript_12119/m.32610 type:complete len:375 (+) Transcript_12119:250-1374(+)|eukprot:CAMPEP_0185829294 /NCGR_PEP_ID=MMETSP1353-20130828/163_1 /TAXON_ID=1077150 /ORGANISM="Erythrolobus australicus, Strain CCMP3124" /LENGTH=374 /DNA_ID=CAMNT_0028527061 /DNA_START=217 /DNA_END=1341 /DNA_ORIENTATION=+
MLAARRGRAKGDAKERPPLCVETGVAGSGGDANVASVASASAVGRAAAEGARHVNYTPRGLVERLAALPSPTAFGNFLDAIPGGEHTSAPLHINFDTQYGPAPTASTNGRVAPARVKLEKDMPTFAVMQPSGAMSSGSAVASASTPSRHRVDEDENEDEEEDDIELDDDEKRDDNDDFALLDDVGAEKTPSASAEGVASGGDFAPFDVSELHATRTFDANGMPVSRGVKRGLSDAGDRNSDDAFASKSAARISIKRMKPDALARADASYQKSKANVERLERQLVGITDKKLLRQLKNRLAAERSRMIQRERASKLSKINIVRADKIAELEVENSSLKKELEYLAMLEKHAALRASGDAAATRDRASTSQHGPSR